MIKVKAIEDFQDYKEEVTRYVGDEFEVTEERYEEIIEKGGNWVIPVEEDDSETAEDDSETAEDDSETAAKGKKGSKKSKKNDKGKA